MRYLLHRFLQRMHLLPSDPFLFALQEQQAAYVRDLAAYEKCAPDLVLYDLIQDGMRQRLMAQETWQNWDSLSPREKEVAGLVCLEYTNRAIANRLVISMDTVRTHVRNILFKFNLHSKGELRVVLADWDFSAWENNT
jgi:DNA-binding CsgD family transcriptional regulator